MNYLYYIHHLLTGAFDLNRKEAHACGHNQ